MSKSSLTPVILILLVCALSSESEAAAGQPQLIKWPDNPLFCAGKIDEQLTSASAERLHK